MATQVLSTQDIVLIGGRAFGRNPIVEVRLFARIATVISFRRKAYRFLYPKKPRRRMISATCGGTIWSQVSSPSAMRL
jgi:hypothetical protein